MKSREIALSGIVISLQVITLLIIYVVPTIKLALLFASSLYLGVLLRLGVKKTTGILSFVVSSALILFLVHVVDITVMYIAFFGWYGIVHESTKHLKMSTKQIIRWVCFILSAALLYVGVTYFIKIDLKYALYLYAIFGVLAFAVMQVLYELCTRELIRLTGIRIVNGKITFKR